MKVTLREFREIVRGVLREVFGNKCIKCGYDNPYMDPVEDYVCRQCKSHQSAWAGDPAKSQKPETKPVAAQGGLKVWVEDEYGDVKAIWDTEVDNVIRGITPGGGLKFYPKKPTPNATHMDVRRDATGQYQFAPKIFGPKGPLKKTSEEDAIKYTKQLLAPFLEHPDSRPMSDDAYPGQF